MRGDLPLRRGTRTIQELVESSTGGKQFGDSAVFDHCSVGDEQDTIGMPDAGQSMRDDDPGAWPQIGGQRVDHGGFVLGVQRAGRLVDEQYRSEDFSNARAMLTRWRSPPDSAAPACYADRGPDRHRAGAA